MRIISFIYCVVCPKIMKGSSMYDVHERRVLTKLIVL